MVGSRHRKRRDLGARKPPLTRRSAVPTSGVSGALSLSANRLVARHRLLDWNRRLHKERIVPISNLADRVSGDDPARLIVEAEATDEAVAIVTQLPPAQAEVLLLRLIAGLDVAETAAALGKRPGTVRVLQHRALRNLADALDREPTEER